MFELAMDRSYAGAEPARARVGDCQAGLDGRRQSRNAPRCISCCRRRTTGSACCRRSGARQRDWPAARLVMHRCFDRNCSSRRIAAATTRGWQRCRARNPSNDATGLEHRSSPGWRRIGPVIVRARARRSRGPARRTGRSRPYAKYMDALTQIRSDTAHAANAVASLESVATGTTGAFADQVHLTAAQVAYEGRAIRGRGPHCGGDWR